MKNIRLPEYRKIFPYDRQPVFQPEQWEKAEDLFEQGNYTGAVAAVLEYAHPGITRDTDTSAPFRITQPHGSTVVSLEVTGKELKIEAPFLKITKDTNRVALLRKTSEISFAYLYLSKIVLRDGALYFDASFPLPLCLPSKVYNTLYNICDNADYFDEKFIDQFGAEFVHHPQIQPLDGEMQDKLWEQWQHFREDYYRMLKDFTGERLEHFHWEAVAVTLLKIGNISYLNGKLKPGLSGVISVLLDKQLDMKERIDHGKVFLDKLFGEKRENILSNFYKADYFMSTKMRSDKSIVSEFLMQYQSVIDNFEKNNRPLGMAYGLFYIFQLLLYRYNVDKELRDRVESCLEAVSEKPAGKAAGKLKELYDSLVEGRKEHKKSLWDRWFG